MNRVLASVLILHSFLVIYHPFTLVNCNNVVTLDNSASETTQTNEHVQDGDRQSLSTLAPPSSTQLDECANNAVDSKCDHGQQEVVKQEVTKFEILNYQIDNQAQLTSRLREFDTLQNMDDVFYRLFGPQDSLNATPATADDRYEHNQPTLRQVLLVHRHGDRTPIQFPENDPLRNEPFWQFHGFAQLTNRGKARVYLLGKMIRKRYGKFLGNSVNKNQRISRSSGSLRCIESAQMFLAGFLSLANNCSTDAKDLIWDKNNQLATLWQPASIQSVPIKFDGLLAESAECKALMEEYESVIENSELVQSLYTEYKHEASVMEEVLGFKIDHFYKWFWASSQIEVEREYFGSKMDKRILEIYDKMQAAGNVAITAFQSTMKAKRLRNGMLISDMISNMKQFRDRVMDKKVPFDSKDLKKFVHYSAHDLTLVNILGMLEQWEKFPYRPEYASNIALELHQDLDEWFVKFFYMPEVPMTPIELHIARCEESNAKSRCTIDRLAEIVQPYMIANWQSWMQECKNDIYSIDPYTPGI